MKQVLIFFFAYITPLVALAQDDQVSMKAQDGDAEAQYTMSLRHPDSDEGIAWCRKAAEQNYAPALDHLAYYYREGQGIAKDLTKAAELYQQAAAQGYGPSLYNLGVFYDNGWGGLPKDAQKAVNLYSEAAGKGFSVAQNKVAELYYMNRMYDDALEWFKKAADQGYVPAYMNLFGIYFDGKGVEKNPITAWGYLQEAADKGDATARQTLTNPAFEYILGYCYLYGKFTEGDPNLAEPLMEKAAKQGFAAAQYELAKLYRDGLGVNRDKEEMVRWLTKAALQNHYMAMLELSICYENGDGVEKSHSEAKRWDKARNNLKSYEQDETSDTFDKYLKR